MTSVLCSMCDHSAFTVTRDHGPLCRDHYLRARPQIRKEARFRTAPCPHCGEPVLFRLDPYSTVLMKCPHCHKPCGEGVPDG